MNATVWAVLSLFLFVLSRILRRPKSSIVALKLPKQRWDSDDVDARQLVGSIVGVLDSYKIRYKVTANGICVPPHDRSGFAVSLFTSNKHARVAWGEWSLEVNSNSGATALFLAGLCDQYRLTILSVDGVDCLWAAGFFAEGDWVSVWSSQVRHRRPRGFWKRTQVRYAQNSFLSEPQLRHHVRPWVAESQMTRYGQT